MAYSFVLEGYLDGVQYVTVLDASGNPVAYNIPIGEAERRYPPKHEPSAGMKVWNTRIACAANIEATDAVMAVRIFDHQLQAAGFSTLTDGGREHADAFEAEEGTEPS